MAKLRWRDALIGGAANAVDGIDGDDLLDSDLTFGLGAGIVYPYWLDADGAGADSSPDRILPDTNPGTKVHLLASMQLKQLFLSNPNIEVLAAEKTIAVGDPQIQALDPGGLNRDVLLPAEASSVGLFFFIANTADAAEDLVVKEDSDTTTIVTISQNERGLVFCDGVTWYGFMGGKT